MENFPQSFEPVGSDSILEQFVELKQNVLDSNEYVKTTAQSLSESEKAQARSNIGASQGATEVVDSLDSNSTTAALSANQGRVLNEQAQAISSQVENHTNEISENTAAIAQNDASISQANAAIVQTNTSIAQTNASIETLKNDINSSVGMVPSSNYTQEVSFEKTGSMTVNANGIVHLYCINPISQAGYINIANGVYGVTVNVTAGYPSLILPVTAGQTVVVNSDCLTQSKMRFIPAKTI